MKNIILKWVQKMSGNEPLETAKCCEADVNLKEPSGDKDNESTSKDTTGAQLPDPKMMNDIEKLLTVSKEELGSAIGKIESSTNSAIQDFMNITMLFGNRIGSTNELVNNIKNKLHLFVKNNSSVSDKNSEVLDDNASCGVIKEKYESVINHILEEMGSIVKRKEEDLALLNEVNNQVSKIKSFSDEISNIAMYSHILSVNARIQAAHAGEVGSGFAVVAQEMDRMSIQTRDFAERIDTDLKSAKNFIGESTQTLKQAIDIESSFINSTIFLMKDVFMSIIDGLISLILLVEKSIGESSEVNSKIQNVVVNLQFEDITRQISAHVIQIMMKIIEDIKVARGESVNDSKIEISDSVDTSKKSLNDLFTMESERQIADSVLGNECEETKNETVTNSSSSDDDVTFF